MTDPSLILVLADQISFANPALAAARPGVDRILMAEVAEEAGYVRHNRHKIVLLFSAMRHFADVLRERGFEVTYIPFGQGVGSLVDACAWALDAAGLSGLRVCAPGEYRLLESMKHWPERLGVPVNVIEDSRFLCSPEDFRDWAEGRRQLRMEYFYRDMRARYDLMMEAGAPAGGQWNYDADNRGGWRHQTEIPERPMVEPDAVTRAVIDEVLRFFPDNPGDLDQFRLAVTHEDAWRQFEWFCRHALPNFGRYQDALAEDSPWLFHSLISMYLNCGLLEPLAVCRRVEGAWLDGDCSIAAAEGFIRQVLGWREYVRGVYWLHMPGYGEHNALAAARPLPAFFWDGETDMRCLQVALRQSLDLGYAHHIQRLMVIGNFALLAGLDVTEVCDWFLAVYVDAYEWVELPNTAGMALYADGGVMASKPYAASGKYIQRQGDHCRHCRYKPSKTTGADACPYNSLYWHFVDRHAEALSGNPRMNLVLANWQKRDSSERRAILEQADGFLGQLDGRPAMTDTATRPGSSVCEKIPTVSPSRHNGVLNDNKTPD